jgi:hypothetical protein
MGSLLQPVFVMLEMQSEDAVEVFGNYTGSKVLPPYNATAFNDFVVKCVNSLASYE